MIEIIPAIMPKDLEDLIEKSKPFVGVVPLAQIDIMDGAFVPEVTWPFSTGGADQLAQMIEGGGGLPFWKEIGYEFDLMVDRPERTLDKWIALSPKRLIFHIESTDKMTLILEQLEAHRGSVEVGLSLDTSTPNEMLIPYLDAKDTHSAPLINFVQCMGIARIGYQGEPFDDRALTKITQLRERYPELIISVDGGVNFDSAPKLIEAGVNRLVSGSAISESGDVPAAIERFKALSK